MGNGCCAALCLEINRFWPSGGSFSGTQLSLRAPARTQDRESGPAGKVGMLSSAQGPALAPAVPDQVWTGLRTICISKLLWALQTVTPKVGREGLAGEGR